MFHSLCCFLQVKFPCFSRIPNFDDSCQQTKIEPDCLLLILGLAGKLKTVVTVYNDVYQYSVIRYGVGCHISVWFLLYWVPINHQPDGDQLYLWAAPRELHIHKEEWHRNDPPPWWRGRTGGWGLLTKNGWGGESQMGGGKNQILGGGTRKNDRGKKGGGGRKEKIGGGGVGAEVEPGGMGVRTSMSSPTLYLAVFTLGQAFSGAKSTRGDSPN